MATLIRTVEISASKEEAQAQGLKNLNALNFDGADQDPRHAFMAVLERSLTPKAKLYQLQKASNRLGNLVTPHSACKSGCSHCCNISAIICETEAKAISKATGRAMAMPEGVPSPMLVTRWHKVPCPFLKKGRCSVYDDRPMVCRLMFNMADTPEQCDTDIPSEDSYVMTLNLKELQQGFLLAFINEQWGDIRDFFPPS
jgi:Fe-S-cluster containining protein